MPHVTVNLNVNVDATGDIQVFGSQADLRSGTKVIANYYLPVNALYDETKNGTKGAGLIEFWEPSSDLGNIHAKLAVTNDFNVNSVSSYKRTAKLLASGLQRLLVDSLDAKDASPFNDEKYKSNGQSITSYTTCSDFGRLALSTYSHYLFGHVAATAAITNDEAFMKSMLSLDSNTNSVKVDGTAPGRYAAWTHKNVVDTTDINSWSADQGEQDANLAISLVKAIIAKGLQNGNPVESVMTGSSSNANTIANIVKQVIGQDAERAMGQDNNQLAPDVHQLLRFYQGDTIYVSVTLDTPKVTVTPVSNNTVTNSGYDKETNISGVQKEKYDIAITLGPRNNEYDVWRQIGDDIYGEAAYDISGSSVSLSADGSIVAIGATYNDGKNVNNETIMNSGHVRVYKYDNINDVWTQIGQDIDGEAAYDQSGRSVSLSDDGSIIAIGATFNDGVNENNETIINSGHVRVYKYDNINNVWTQIGDDIDGEAAYDNSGFSVSLSADGSIVAIGAYANDGNGSFSGHVQVYKNINNVWTQIGDDIDGEAADDNSGWSISLSADGSIVAIGARLNAGINENNETITDSGHVRVYKYDNINNVWTQIGKDIDGEAAGDENGFSVSLSADGSIVAIGARYNAGNGIYSGHVRVYKNINNVWTQIGDDIDGEAAGDQSGWSISLSADGSIVAIGATNNAGINENNETITDSGHVRVYKYDNINNVWTQIGKDIDGKAAGDWSGFSVSLSADGSIVAIGARLNDGNGTDSGHVRVYRYD